MTDSDLKRLADEIRGQIIDISHQNAIPHLASNLSCVDILTVAYWSTLDVQPTRADRDRLILSKGHAASALYVCLARKGFIDPALLDTIGTDGSPLAEHPGPSSAPGVEAATGSLGHGLSIGAGIALSTRHTGLAFRTLVVCSDGEMNEGSTWEAAMFAARHQLGLTVVIDFNKWQATGRSQEVLAIDPLVDKWQAFGWHTQEVDGHDHAALRAAMAGQKPCQAIIAHTIKGKGVSFMEDDNNWHYRIPTADEVAQAHRELGLS